MDKASVSDSLVVIWVSGDLEVAKKMVFMYRKNSKFKGWWGRVRLVVWGPSAQLLSVEAGQQIKSGLAIVIERHRLIVYL